ncbi:IRC7-like protein [Lachancea thermotolerans]
MSVVKSGYHILAPDKHYDLLWGLALEELIKPNITVLFIESLGPGTMEVQDTPALVAVAKIHELRTILDYTWTIPIFLRLMALVEQKAHSPASWLKNRTEVEKALQLAFKEGPGYSWWLCGYKDPSGLFYVIVGDGFTKESLELMLENMGIFKLSYSWWSSWGSLLCFKVEIEDIEDMKNDFDLGFKRLVTKGKPYNLIDANWCQFQEKKE